MVFLGSGVSLVFKRLGSRARLAPVATAAITLAVFAALLHTAMQRPHKNKAYIRQAGLYIGRIAVGSHVLLADNSRTVHYAGIPYRVFDPDSVTAAGFRQELARDPAITLVAFSEKCMAEAAGRDPALADIGRDGRLKRIAEFSQAGGNPDKIVVYCVRPAASAPSR